MHIPACETTQLELLQFAPALEAANRPGPDYDITKWIYVPNFYSEYRYILGTRGENPLICVGINPSTAAPDALDNTLKSVERVAHFNGYDSFLMFNVYAQRATNPDDMEFIYTPALHRENLTAFDYAGPSGRPGGPSLRSGTTCPAASGTWWIWAQRGAPGGSAPESAPKRATRTTPSICGRTVLWSPLTSGNTWQIPFPWKHNRRRPTP